MIQRYICISVIQAWFKGCISDSFSSLSQERMVTNSSHWRPPTVHSVLTNQRAAVGFYTLPARAQVHMIEQKKLIADSSTTADSWPANLDVHIQMIPCEGKGNKIVTKPPINIDRASTSEKCVSWKVYILIPRSAPPMKVELPKRGIRNSTTEARHLAQKNT